MIKLLVLAVGIFIVYKWYSIPSISAPKEKGEDDYIDYEEVD